MSSRVRVLWGLLLCFGIQSQAPSLFADDSILVSESCAAIVRELVRPHRTRPAFKPPSPGVFGRILSAIGLSTFVSTVKNPESTARITTTETIINVDENSVFLKILPNTIKLLRDELPPVVVNHLIKITLEIILEKLSIELDSNLTSNQIVDFSSIRFEYNGDLSQNKLQNKLNRALKSISPEVRSFLKNRLPEEIFKKTAGKRETLFEFGIGRNFHEAKIAARSDKTSFQEIRDSLVLSLKAYKELVREIKVLFTSNGLDTPYIDRNTQQLSILFFQLIRTKDTSKIEATLQKQNPNLKSKDLKIIAKKMLELRQLLSTLTPPTQYADEAHERTQQMQLNSDTPFLLSFDIEGVGARVMREIHRRLSASLENRTDDYIAENLSQIIEESSPFELLTEIFEPIEQILETAFSLNHRDYWLTGDEVTFAFSPETLREEVLEFISQITAKTGFENIRISLAHLQTSAGTPIGFSVDDVSGGDILRDYTEELQKAVKAEILSSSEERFQFFAELQLPEGAPHIVFHLISGDREKFDALLNLNLDKIVRNLNSKEKFKMIESLSYSIEDSSN